MSPRSVRSVRSARPARSARRARAAAACSGCAVALAAGAAGLLGAGSSGAAPAPTTPLVTTPAARPASADAKRLAKAKTFMPALGVELTSKNVKALAKRDLVVVDGDGTTSGQIKRLKAKGALVLGYLSVGTVESWRPWFDSLKGYRLEPLGDWPGERYTDVSKEGARNVLADTIAPKLLAKGFDGLFLDNVDMVSDHPAQAAGMLDLVNRLADGAHANGDLLMAQNGDDIIAPFMPALDAWNREDATGTYDFETKKYVLSDAEGRRSARATIGLMRKAGIVATTTDYYASPSSRGAKGAIRIACKAGAIPFVGTISLASVPKTIAHC